MQVYGSGDEALHAAYAEFKRTFEKRGDHWIPKTGRYVWEEGQRSG